MATLAHAPLVAPQARSSRLRRGVGVIILLLPVINALADVTTNYFPSGAFNPAAVRAALLGAVVLYFITTRLKFDPTSAAIAVFLAYLFTRAILATEVAYSVGIFVKVALSMVMFSVGYAYLSTQADLQRFARWTVPALFVALAQLAVAQFVGFGKSLYVEDSFYLGGGLGTSLYHFGLVLALPLAWTSFGSQLRRFSAGLVGLASFVVLFIALKRGPLVGVVLGFLAYTAYAHRKRRAMKHVLAAIAVLVLLTPVILPFMVPRIEARFSEKQRIERQARYIETLVVWDEFMNKSVAHSAVGSELFNSPQYFGVRRQLHVDFNILLHGSGIIGLGLYLTVFVVMIRQFRRWSRRAGTDPFVAEAKAVFVALGVFALVVSFALSLPALGFRSTLFLYLGGIIGFLRMRALGENEVSPTFRPAVQLP